MEQLDYNIIKKMKQEINDIDINAKQLKEYNIKQNYLRAVSRLCNSGIIADWISLNEVVNFDYIKTCEFWDDTYKHWRPFIDKRVTLKGEVRDDGNFYIAFNPQTTWVKNKGCFGVYRSFGSCGDTNMLWFGPKDVDTLNQSIYWHEYRGTDVNQTYIEGSYFGEAFELRTFIINELVDNYERYRQYAYDKTIEYLNKKKEKALEAQRKAMAILDEGD